MQAASLTRPQTVQDHLVDHASAKSTTSKRLCEVEASHWLRSSVSACSTTEDAEKLYFGLGYVET